MTRPVPAAAPAAPAGPAPAGPSDALLVRRVLAGDAEAFGDLVTRHHARCLRIAVHLVGDPADAEDAVQEALLRAYRHLGGYQEDNRFGAWLTRILVNQCRNQCRAASARARRPVPPDVEWARAERATAHPADAAAQRAELACALGRLPADQREAVVLRYADELTYDEMAAATGATVAALKMRVQRGCRRLRALLTAPTPAPAPTLERTDA